MDSQGSPIPVSTGNPPAVGGDIRVQASTIPPPPFFPNFPHHDSQIPFLFPNSFMPPFAGVGFATPVQGVVGMKMALLMSMQQTMQKLVKKL